jgi:predicted GNAT family acetyltransferase
MTWTVTHRPELQRFEVDLDGHLALCSYRVVGQTVVLHHTEVPPAHGGRGIAAGLVQAALAWAREQGLKVQPRCSYVAAYMQRHPDTLDLLDPGS